MHCPQAFGFSKEFSFLSAPATGPSSTVHVLHTADLGHVTLDGADEYDYDWSEDPMNFDPTGTFDRVRTLQLGLLACLAGAQACTAGLGNRSLSDTGLGAACTAPAAGAPAAVLTAWRAELA